MVGEPHLQSQTLVLYLRPSCTEPAPRLDLRILCEASRRWTEFLIEGVLTFPISPLKFIKSDDTYFSKFLSFLLSSSRCLNFISFLRRRSMLPWLIDKVMLFWELWRPSPDSAFYSFSSIATAAKRIFLIRLSSCTKVIRASFVFSTSSSERCLSKNIYSTFLKLMEDLVRRTAISTGSLELRSWSESSCSVKGTKAKS